MNLLDFIFAVAAISYEDCAKDKNLSFIMERKFQLWQTTLVAN